MSVEKRNVGTLVIGAGVIGSSVAMHLAEKGIPDVKCVDFDLEGTLSSSELNAGGVRATWAQPLNIQASQLTIDYFAKNAEEVGYRPVGYLWLHTKERMPAALKARDLQTSMGWPVEAWDVPELRRRVPFVDKTEGIEGAIFAPRDGLVNPNLLKNHFRAKAKEKGATFDDRVWIRAAEAKPGARIKVTADVYSRALTQEEKIAVYSGRDPGVAKETREYSCERVVNCAGPWAMGLAKMLGYDCPSQAVRRQICIFDCRDVDLSHYGMIIDTSGVYFHPEATNGLAGIANRDEPSGVNFNYDGEDFFMERIWSALYERSTGFERLKHLTGWAGLYEVSPDDSAIVGKVENGEAGRHGGVYEAHSFSGHGVMHSYTVGLAMAEMISQGRYSTIDLSPLAGRRFESGQLLKEGWVI